MYEARFYCDGLSGGEYPDDYRRHIHRMHEARFNRDGLSGRRYMLTLIKREMTDHIVFFAAAVGFSAVLSGLLAMGAFGYHTNDVPVFIIGLTIPIAVIVIFGPAVMGADQMNIDRAQKISALLSTMPTRRSSIFLARVIVGVAAIGALLVPLAVTAVFLVHALAPPIPMFRAMVYESLWTAFLMAMAFYCGGLQSGWTSNRFVPTLTALGITVLLLPLVAIKGPGVHLTAILTVFIAASLARAWSGYAKAAL